MTLLPVPAGGLPRRQSSPPVRRWRPSERGRDRADAASRAHHPHRLDAARLYRLALEKGTAGSRYHGVAEEGIPIRNVAEIIGKRLGVPAVSKTAEEVVGALGFIGQVLAMDEPSSSTLTQERLGWRPTQPGLLADLEKGTYFDAT